MKTGCTVVLDVGKTHAKLTLWDPSGDCLARHRHANLVVDGPGYRALDTAGLDTWLRGAIADAASRGRVRAIVPVAHGAAAALISAGRLWTPPMDYEDAPTEGQRSRYRALRDGFEDTGSPCLPLGLNLGQQLHRLEDLVGPWPADTRILTWPQYWAWRLSGVMACEVTSLGCHSDLWRPYAAAPSQLSLSRGWAARLGAPRPAGSILGPVTAEWTTLGLPTDCVVHCGLHDSNAALLAARRHGEIAGRDATVLSTGTWFVALRTPGAGAEPPRLDPGRDSLVNVDVEGRPTPSARFMGGREVELIAALEADAGPSDVQAEVEPRRLEEAMAGGAFLRPSFAPAGGPFPGRTGRWVKPPGDAATRRGIVDVYLALMADQALDLIGSRDRLLVEGRFAETQGFVTALAALRSPQTVFVAPQGDAVAHGARSLVEPDLPPPAPLSQVSPMAGPLVDYRRRWLAEIARPDA